VFLEEAKCKNTYVSFFSGKNRKLFPEKSGTFFPDKKSESFFPVKSETPELFLSEIETFFREKN
jgi:hypothetical protein